MTRFRYAARTANGERVRGSFVASDRDAAIAGLQGRSLFITAVERHQPWTTEFRLPVRVGQPSHRSRVAFFRSFATLIRAGVEIRRSLHVAIERTSSERLRDSLREVLTEIERGNALSSALARRPRIFSRLIVAMIAAGETGGILDDVLMRIASLLEKDERLRKAVISALAYPATVLAASFCLVAFLIVRIVPMFADLFESFHTDLPASTRFLLWLGAILHDPRSWLGIIAMASLGFGLVIVARRTRRGALAFDRIRLAVPLVGELLRTSIHARFARTLGTLVHSGVELATALDVVRPVMGSPLHENALGQVVVALREGEALNEPLGSTRLFDPMLISLIAIGEETGMLDVMLEKAADYFEDDVAATISTLGAVIEPALIVILGVLVGFIVYSVYIPLYSLIGSISK